MYMCDKMFEVIGKAQIYSMSHDMIRFVVLLSFKFILLFLCSKPWWWWWADLACPACIYMNMYLCINSSRYTKHNVIYINTLLSTSHATSNVTMQR